MVCIDTTFLIDLLKGRKEVEPLKDELQSMGEQICVPAPVVMEFVTGVFLRENHENEMAQIRLFLQESVTLPFDEEASLLAGELVACLIKKGESIDVEDVMIGAIARQHNETLITRNKKHFDRIPGLVVRSY